MARSTPRRLPLWLPAAGAFVGVCLLAVRLTTVPLDQTSPYFVVVILGLAAILLVLTGRTLVTRRRSRAVIAAHPDSLVMPIVGGVDTSAATRWLAEKLDDPHLALRPEKSAFVVADASGLRLTDGSTTSRPLAADALSALPLTTVRAGGRQVDALVVGVAVGGVVAPLPLVPARSSIVARGALTDAELLEVSGRLHDVLAGAPATPGWPY